MSLNANQNAAAYLNAAKAHPFEVKPAPAWTPGDSEILVKNHVVAINPVDGNLQYMAFFPLKYPTILGQDVAGEVVQVGPGVTRFKVGDRVVGHAVAMATGRHEDSGFQHYTILQTNMASHIPADMLYETAAVLPLGLSTAASALFRSEFLNLQVPTVPAQRKTGKTVLVWGGASSVGSNGIQLCVAAGYEVVAVASSRNFDYVKRLGATEALDYNSSSVKDDLLNAFKNRELAGVLDCIGSAAWAICVEKSHGNKFVATCKRGFPEPPEGVKLEAVFGTIIKDNEISTAIYENFLPKALEAGTYVPSPEPLVAGQGLESLQAAVDLHRAGVSARKIVVRL
ncbi:zinc-binding oxidoreductase CipB [Purpureocillium lavendulum]|uniref:Zinc-binding oxidoreductase CipB n=1 Tax=Purpureocillium lavendulum TaxID=1247861 RepID=A0AB34FY28_9HYPO|nr:zinc-binding oxidoreductase CipB [Purpureocillium lavendulum]